MKPVLVGSRALAYWVPEFTPRENADWDIICEEPKLFRFIPEVDSQRVETHTFDELNNDHLCLEYATDTRAVSVNGVECNVMTLDGLAVMKRSHLWRAHFFEKHIAMYHKYLAKHLPTDRIGQQLLKDRIKLTKEKYPQRNPSLKQTNDDFFDDFVEKEFDHDWIHELVAHYERPLFERLKQPDGMSDAWCEKDLWEKLSYEDKCRCVAEECHVIACERFMIPTKWEHFQKLAYFKALNKVCTTLTSGWFRDHAIDNFPQIVELYDPLKFDKVKHETRRHSRPFETG